MKIMLSSPMNGKSREEIDSERNKMADIIFDYYGDDCEIIASSVTDHESKSPLECLSESIFFMSTVDLLVMGFGWEDARGCRFEHEIAKAYDLPVVCLDEFEGI